MDGNDSSSAVAGKTTRLIISKDTTHVRSQEYGKIQHRRRFGRQCLYGIGLDRSSPFNKVWSLSFHPFTKFWTPHFFRINFILMMFLTILNLNYGCDAFSLTMGLLKVGTPQPWQKSKPNLRYVREAGVRQFISTYNRVENLKGDELLWGDEIEYGLFVLEPETKSIRLCLRAEQIMDDLNDKEKSHLHRMEGCHWVPEYGGWMIEATPNRPYTGFTNDLLRVERNMRLRRRRLVSVLRDNEIAPTVSTFPLLGALGDDGSVPATSVGGNITESAYIGDGIINSHPRFGALTANIRKRRGEKVTIRVPLYKDLETPEYKKMRTDEKGCDCESGSLQLWRYGKGDISRKRHGDNLLVVGCSSSEFPIGPSLNEEDTGEPITLEKWQVNVEIEGCLGLYYRSSPNIIVSDADWPRNGEFVTGIEVPDIPGGWVRLQNGYYLPIQSENGKIKFLHKVTPANTMSPSIVRNNSITSSTMPLVGGGGTPVIAQAGGTLPAMADSGSSVTTKTEMAVQEKEKQQVEQVRPAIHMDAMAFGMGCCCIQVTFQAQDMEESRFIYDQLAVLTPILMALTASTPLLRGRIADTDCRWGIISECVDDRTPAERGLKNEEEQESQAQEELVGKGQRRLYKSRYDSISTYICQGATMSASSATNDSDSIRGIKSNRVLNIYNDLPVPIDEGAYKRLRKNGVDPALSQHIAHLFVRDPLVVFDGAVEEVDDATQTDHFESIQSTNWQTVRWKPPPPRSDPYDLSPHIGWRTEFRSMEIQLTDFENAAFTAFVVLVTRVLISFDLNLYVPLSRVDANMQRAHTRNAAVKGEFFFRRHLAPLEEGDDGFGMKYKSMFASNGKDESINDRLLKEQMAEKTNTNNDNTDTSSNSATTNQREVPSAIKNNILNRIDDEENSYEEMTMAEIMTGKGDYFPGLIPLVYAYLDYINCDTTTRARLSQYLTLIEKRAMGELLTPATYIRQMVQNHPKYQNDSVVSKEIAYDLMVACHEIGLGKRPCPELLGDITIEELTMEGAYDVKLDSKRIHSNEQLIDLVQRYTKRRSK